MLFVRTCYNSLKVQVHMELILPKNDDNSLLKGSKPILKWAGGKGQLLTELVSHMPQKFNKYIEPFFGGGALFFHYKPMNAIIADSSPELVNLYRVVAESAELVIEALRKYKNDEEMFYAVRKREWTELASIEAAARTIYLNKTCFNGLYRVNRQGQFNVPFGRYKNPRILDRETLLSSSFILKRARIISDDYKKVLHDYAKEGDFIYLDPPYLPISKYSDFKRYTKDQFYEEDHIELSKEVELLHELGCYIVLTNSNHPLVHELYRKFDIKVVQTKRYISSNVTSRHGEDVIVTIPPKRRFILRLVPDPLPVQIEKFPSTRFMGAKSKLLPHIWDVASQFDFETALDLFSGTGIVGYMLKAQGKIVTTNDYMCMASTYSKAMIENNTVTLSQEEAEALLVPGIPKDSFVENTFTGLYFSDDDNRLIDVLRANIKAIEDPYKQAIAMSALIRACIKKRPRGIFTYIGQRYDDGRRDLQLSFEAQFLEAVQAVNNAVFNNSKKNKVRWGDAMTIRVKPDLVYIDPPYFSPLSDNEYVRRYHFVEGLARDWRGLEIQDHTATKKFKSYPTPFSSRKGAADAFDKLFRKFRDSIIIVSYSSNCLPTLDEMVSILNRHKKLVDVVSVDHRYSFGNQRHKMDDNNNAVKEYLFVGY